VANHSYLRRLPKEHYQARAIVLWSMTIDGRRTGWLSDRLHLRFRELLLHVQHRESLLCPGYVLMPDHLHFIWMGTGSIETSDQRRAATFLRRELNRELRGLEPSFELQLQGHDRVLGEEERERGAFQSAVHYVLQNPVRAGLVSEAHLWPHSGVIACGYPNLDWRQEDFWSRFWKIYAIEVGDMAK
jgi:REP element-mobilizing transposase RayT